MIGVTLLAAACGWQMKTVRERAAVLEWLRQRAPLENIPRVTPGYASGQDEAGRWEVIIYDDDLSWFRRLLGDHWVPLIAHPANAPNDEVNRVRSAFPEAHIITWSDTEVSG